MEGSMTNELNLIKDLFEKHLQEQTTRADVLESQLKGLRADLQEFKNLLVEMENKQTPYEQLFKSHQNFLTILSKYALDEMEKMHYGDNLAPQYHQVPNGYVKRHIAAMGTNETTPISHDLERLAQRIECRHFEGKNKKIAICTMALGDGYREKVKYCLASHRKYCEQHDLSFYCQITETVRTDRPFSWRKIPLVHNILSQGHDRVIFLDADTLILNYEKNLDSFFHLPEGKSLLITEDEWSIGAGVLCCARTPDAFRLLDLIWMTDCFFKKHPWEQQALKMLINSYPEVREAVQIEKNPKLFNSFPVEHQHQQRWQDYTRGDFLVHMSESGLPTNSFKNLIKKYMVEYGPKDLESFFF